MSTIAACGEKAEQEPVIGKQDIKVENGQFTPEIMHQLGKVSDPQVSPDGTKILYGVSYTSIEQNRSNRELFVMNIDGSDNHQITTSAKGESNARWIDGGKRIAYLRGGQMFTASPEGKDEKQVSNVEGGISEFKISADGKKVMYITGFKVNKAPKDVHPDLEKANVRTIDAMMYRHWDHFVEEIPHTFVAPFDGEKLGEGVDILGGEPFELPTEPFSGIEQLNFSPDGSTIVYSCRKKTGRDYAFSTNTDIYLYDIATGATVNISEGMMGYDTDPVFSPDGNYVAWLSMERDGYESDRVRLFIYNMAGGSRKELSTSFDNNAASPVWMPDSKGLWFCADVQGLGEIWKTDLEGNMSRLTPEREWYDFGAVQPCGDVLIATNQSLMRPSEIISISQKDGSWKQLSHENDEVISQLAECRCEERWIPTSDGKKMLTWVIYPPQFDAAKKYPAVLICLGGPQGTISQGWSTRWNYRLWASQGYIMVLPNRRGTTSFGQEWCEQISGDYIGQNMKDYFAAADALLAEPYVGKMAAAGASYGGYSIYYLAGTHNKRFSAFIAHAGIFDQEHMYMETEEMWFPDWDNGGCRRPGEYMAGSPWSDNPAAKRHYANSAHKLVQNWDTPILVIHGELDYRVPVDQGMSAFNAAQMMGVPSKMLLFPEENHWILKPQNSVFWHREVFDWINKWCKE